MTSQRRVPDEPVCFQNRTEDERRRQLETAAKQKIQGSLIKSRLLFLHIRHGLQTLKKIVRTLPEADQSLLMKTVYVGEWYPLDMLVRLDLAIEAELADQYDNLFEELGAFSADLNVGGAYEPLMKKDVHALLNLSAVMNKTYQDFGKATYTPDPDNRPDGMQTAYLELEYPEPPPSHYCQEGLGYFRHAVQLCGGRSVEAGIAECRQEGGTKCRFRISWTPPTDLSIGPR